MSQVTVETIKSIGRVRTQVELLQFEDNENLIKVGAALEAVMTDLPESCTLANESVVLCLHALQAIFQGEVEDLEMLRRSISATLIGIEQGLAFPPHPAMDKLILRGQTGLRSELEKISQSSEKAAQSEEVLVTEEITVIEETLVIEEVAPQPEAKNETSISDSKEMTSLDDIASLLIQVDANDKEDLMRLRDSVKRMSGQAENSESIRKLLSHAAREINQVIKTGNAEFLNTAGSLIEEAMNILENGEPAVEEIPEIQKAETENIETQKIEEIPVATEIKTEVSSKKEEQVSSVLTPDVVSTDESDRALLTEFVTESSEYIEAAEGALLLLENEPDNVEAINTVFRAFHTVKGTAAFLGFSRLGELAHFAESLLSRMRDREIRCVGGYANLALRSSDQIKEMVLAVGEALNGKPLTLPKNYEELISILKNPEAAGVSVDEKIVPIKEIEALQEELSVLKTNTVSNEKTVDSTVRVRTDRLDSLIDIVGELVIAQSMLAQDSTANQAGQHELIRKISHAGKIVRELQTLTMTMRMIPLKNTFQKMARVVRDVAQKCGKQVEFVTEGEDTEIDRNMVDIVADPLIHMVRNAVDHGIEMPDLREENGKSRTGKVRLAAYHAGGDVVVELRDDGAGLDAEKLLKKAIDKGLIESDKNLSESEIYNLIFAPGFSTAEQVTDVSGRGVGMDVVRRNIEAMRGRIEISSEKGKGSLFTIRLPLTLAITDGMLVRVGNERYIIPTVHIHLSFRPNASSISTIAGKGEMVHLRGELMPIIRLHSLFEVKDGVENPTEGSLVIVADGRRRCAILVDELLGQQQAVAKTLGRGVGKIQGVSGGAILGDGRVGLILDTAELVALGRQITGERDRHETPLRKVA